MRESLLPSKQDNISLLLVVYQQLLVAEDLRSTMGGHRPDLRTKSTSPRHSFGRRSINVRGGFGVRGREKLT